MVDADGSYRYSSVVKMNIVSRAGFIEVAPNPFGAKLTVRIESEIQDQATIVVSDLGGRQLVRMQKQLQSGNNAFDITEAGKFANGVYMVTITTKESTQTIKVTKGN